MEEWWPAARTGDLVTYLDDEEHRRLVAATEPAEVEAGAIVLHKGSPSRSLLMIEDGELEIVEESMGETVVLDRIGAGAVVGEVGFVDGQARTHDVRAARPSRLRRLTRERLLALASGDPTLFAKLTFSLAEIMARRFRSAVSGLQPLRAFAASLTEPMEVPESLEASDDEPVAYDEIDEPLSEQAIEFLRDLAKKSGRDVAGM